MTDKKNIYRLPLSLANSSRHGSGDYFNRDILACVCTNCQLGGVFLFGKQYRHYRFFDDIHADVYFIYDSGVLGD